MLCWLTYWVPNGKPASVALLHYKTCCARGPASAVPSAAEATRLSLTHDIIYNPWALRNVPEPEGTIGAIISLSVNKPVSVACLCNVSIPPTARNHQTIRSSYSRFTYRICYTSRSSNMQISHKSLLVTITPSGLWEIWQIRIDKWRAGVMFLGMRYTAEGRRCSGSIVTS